jgi:Uma2 family endonuclease
MNVRTPASAFRPRSPAPRTTRAAHGLPRRAFTVKEVERMYRRGILGPEERIELIGGELVPMAAKGIRHEVLKRAILRHWAALLGQGLEFLVETTLRMSDDTYVVPDIILVPRGQPLFGLRPVDCLLIVEIADGSLRYDLDRKPDIYAAAGAPEVWVLDARRMTATIFRDPVPEGFGRVTAAAAGDMLSPERALLAGMRLDDLDLH